VLYPGLVGCRPADGCLLDISGGFTPFRHAA
jgi:hypothetical protein